MNAKQKAEIYALLRKIVFMRDGEACLRCGKTQRLQLSHIYPKGRYRRMEFDPENLKILCVGCHLYWWHRNPMEAHAWLGGAISKDRMQYLKTKAMYVDKSPFDPKLHILYLKDVLGRLEKGRSYIR